MQEQQDTNQKSCCRGCFRFHRSTLVIAFLLILPWLLVALPGRNNGGAGTTGVWTTRYSHGLPFVFLERQIVEYSGTWTNNKFTPGVKPKNVDFDAQAANNLAAWIDRRSRSPKTTGQFTTAAAWQEDLEISRDGQRRFWSAPNRWPWIGTADGEAMRVRWPRVLIDGALILLAFWLFARVVEYRLKKRSSHFAFSLGELLFATCFAGVLLTCFAIEYRRALKENTAVDRLLAGVNAADGLIMGDRRDSLPILISELFDHRSSFPLIKTPMFRPVERVAISIYDLDGAPDGTAKSLVDAMQKADFPIDLQVNLNEQTLPLFQNGKAISSVETLDLGFGFDSKWGGLADASVVDIDLDFKFNLAKIKELSISLQPEISPSKQLGTITSLASLEQLEIDEINQEGAAYLSSIKSNFPNLKELNLALYFEYFVDNENNTIQDFIDPNFKLKLPEAAKTTIAISLQTEIDQKKQLGTFALVKHLDRLKIERLNQDGVAYLASADTEFPTAKQLEVSFDFFSDLDNPILANKYKIDLDFKLLFPRVEEIKIHLQPEYDQEKQLRMFAPLGRFKYLRIYDVNQQGASYLNSIASELPINTGVEFDSDETVELLPPMKKTYDTPFAQW